MANHINVVITTGEVFENGKKICSLSDVELSMTLNADKKIELLFPNSSDCEQFGGEAEEPQPEKENKVVNDFYRYDDSNDWIDVDPDELNEKDFFEKKGTELEILDFSVRTYNCLKRAGFNYAEQVFGVEDEDIMRIRNLGRKGLEEIKLKRKEWESRTAKEWAEKSRAYRKEKSYIEKLNKLIGLEEVKAQVRKIAAFAKMKKEMAKNGADNLAMAMNMEFLGNPGTAKTTVARIMAGIFYETGLIRNNKLIEVGRSGLVANYTGQTATKVKRVFEMAKGGVLFIDEAYSLVDEVDGSYGDEAISTIVQEMENNREDTIVIFAGYPDKMEKFFATNPGLRSRVPFSIEFKDYSAEELYQIVEYEAKNRNFTIAPQAKDKVIAICKSVEGNAESGNGRFCRNLVEKAILEYAERVYGNDETIAEKNSELIAVDFIEADKAAVTKKNQPIGFMKCA